MKAATTAFTFKTLLRHYAKRALTPSRGLLRDCTTSPINRFVALDNILIFHVSSPHDVWHSSVESVPSVASCNNISLAVIIQPNISSPGLNLTMLTHRQIMSHRKNIILKIIRHIVCCVKLSTSCVSFSGMQYKYSLLHILLHIFLHFLTLQT